MKITQLHTLIREYIPHITFIDSEIQDIVEAECHLWQQEDCACIIDFGDRLPEKPQLLAILNKIAKKLTWLNQQNDAILRVFTQESGLASDGATLQYVAFLIEDEQRIFCDFALNTPKLHEQIIEMSLEENGEIIFNGIENL
ncbi:MAG: hypothetical protein Q4B82_04935 [Alysiella sp.]|uniref:hypothetical protein n=1 Tax=Alysiella sp. TaxID=1872483 RepID=UPI0026DB1345|nr:hypothetical protein [Alysiella sp.]MDO4433908.1 hypothetical protein [Alysiella sp.]